jgi:hypothetical protein
MFLLLSVIAPAHANERFFAWSYGADTTPRGVVEFEPISTVKTHNEAGETVAEWKHEAELEYGITQALETGVYFVTSQTNGGPLAFSGYKGRLRYRFWPLGTRSVDLAAYLEYAGSPTFDEHGIEAKAIVAHEGQDVRAALNVTAELEFEGDEMEPILEPTAGVAWRANEHVALGAETKFEMVFVDPVEGPFVWAGPTLHLAGEEGAIWWTLGGLYGLTGATRDDAAFALRSVIAIPL